MTNGCSFYRDGLPVEQALRLALAYSVTASGKNHWLIAAALDMSPSQFSRATTTNPSDESNQRANFPPEKLHLFIQETQDLSWVLTILDYLGCDSSRLPEIRRATKTHTQVVEELAQEVREARKAVEKASQQLDLMVPLATQDRSKKGGR